MKTRLIGISVLVLASVLTMAQPATAAGSANLSAADLAALRQAQAALESMRQSLLVLSMAPATTEVVVKTNAAAKLSAADLAALRQAQVSLALMRQSLITWAAMQEKAQPAAGSNLAAATRLNTALGTGGAVGGVDLALPELVNESAPAPLAVGEETSATDSENLAAVALGDELAATATTSTILGLPSGVAKVILVIIALIVIWLIYRYLWKTPEEN